MDVLRDLVLPELSKLGPLRRSGSGWMARCPVHEDRQNSLSVGEGRNHPVVFHCHAGCDAEAVCKALGLDWAVLSAPRERQQTDRGFAAIYDYRDEQGELLFQVCRTADKKFLQRKPDPSSRDGYTWKLGDTRRVLYRLQKVLKAVEENREIYLVEGEKDVHSLENQGLVGTCNPGGAGKWKPEYTECLRDAVVVIVADKDKPGQAHARLVREALQGVAADVTVKEAAGDEKVKDVTDHFNAGLTLDDLITTWTAQGLAKPLAAVELWAFLDASDAPPEWVLPELLERNDRLLLTGFEGLGKSMLVRQLALCAAAGLHPFDPGKHSNFEPKRVLFIDCENSETQGRRKMRPIATVMKNYNRAPANNMMFVVHRPNGIDLDTDDADWLIEQVTGYKPDLLVIGPFYKLHSGDINKEENARRVAAVLDHARSISGAALLTEAHAGHGEAGKSRSVRPIGSSLLLRWPEFGYGLAQNALAQPDDRGRCREIDVIAWRGPRDDRDWPKNLQYGPVGHLPWVAWSPPEKREAAP
jgi:5S rRNA maturation endonuclease (ribonuclease M5)